MIVRLCLLTVLSCSILFSSDVYAAKKRKSASSSVQSISAPLETSLVVNTNNGKVLHAKNAKKKIYPASLTKIMTLYLTFDAIESGKLSLNQKLLVSKRAENMRPCKLGLRAGESISVRDCILALVVRSANDAAVVLAERISGSEERFAKLMTLKAKQIGMRDTNFKNASGWHDSAQYTTALDLAKLAMATKHNHKRFYPFFSRTSFEYKGKLVRSHNRVTMTYAGAEGMKTGYTRAAGYNLVTVASRQGKSLVGVVTGGKSSSKRDAKMVELLNRHFAESKITSRNFVDDDFLSSKRQIKGKTVKSVEKFGA